MGVKFTEIQNTVERKKVQELYNKSFPFSFDFGLCLSI